MRLAWPLALPAMLLVPLALAGHLQLERRPARDAVRYTNIDVLAGCRTRFDRWRVHGPAALLLLALACGTLALTRPEQRVTSVRAHASLALAIDESASMSARDLAPTRLTAARAAIGRFVAALPRGYRVGLVTFPSEAYVAAPLTGDHALVLRALAMDDETGPGTAIGDALARSVALLRARDGGPEAARATGSATSDDAPPAIVLLSDGAQTRGVLEPLQGAERAASDGIPIHTVALGTTQGMISQGGISLRVPPDPATLRAISAETGGEFFAAMDDASLNAVYRRLATRLGWETRWRTLDGLLLGIAAALGLAGGLVAVATGARIPWMNQPSRATPRTPRTPSR